MTGTAEPDYTPLRLGSDLDDRIQVGVGEFTEMHDITLSLRGATTDAHLLGHGGPETRGRGSTIETHLTVHQAIRLAAALRDAAERVDGRML